LGAFDAALIRPDDEFCGDLLLDALDGLDPEEFLRSVEAKWAVSIPDGVAAELRTVRQLSAEVARRMGEAQSNKSFDADAQVLVGVPPARVQGAGQVQR
jgi:acyl carrier protein